MRSPATLEALLVRLKAHPELGDRRLEILTHAHPQAWCAAHGLPYEPIEAAGSLPLALRDLDGTVSGVMVGRAEVFCARLDDVTVFGAEGYIATDDGQLLMEGVSYSRSMLEKLYQHQLFARDGARLLMGLGPDAGTMTQEAVLIGGTIGGQPNFGHWLLQYLGKLAALDMCPPARDLPLLVHDTVPDRFVALIGKLGFSNPILRFPALAALRCARLWVPSVPCYRGGPDLATPHIWPSYIHFLRRRLLRDRPAADGPKRVYLSRAGAAHRRLLNQAAVSQRLADHHVVPIRPETLDIDRQIALIAGAELVVAPTGGAVPLTLLGPSDLAVIELSHTRIATEFNARILTALAGQRGRVLVGPAAEDAPPGAFEIDADFTVDLAALDAALALV